MSTAARGEGRSSAEHAAGDAEALFRNLMDEAPVMIWVSGPDKLCTWFNKPWLAFTGRTLEQECGNGWAEGVHHDDLARCLKTYVEHFDAREPFRMEYRLRRADGEYRWILDTGGPRFGSGGVFLGYIGSCIDVDLIKRAEEGAAATAEAKAPPAPAAFDGDETRVRQIARALVTAHRGGAEVIAANVAHRHATGGQPKIAAFWQAVGVSVHDILSREE